MITIKIITFHDFRCFKSWMLILVPNLLNQWLYMSLPVIVILLEKDKKNKNKKNTYILFFPILILDLGITRKYIFIIRMPVAFKVVLFVYINFLGVEITLLQSDYIIYRGNPGLSRDAF